MRYRSRVALFAVVSSTLACSDGSAVAPGAAPDATPDDAAAETAGEAGVNPPDGAAPEAAGGDAGAVGPRDAPPPDGAAPDVPVLDVPPPDVAGAATWPTPNAYSWDGSWTPADRDFPLRCLLDDVYFDGHREPDGTVSPVLPPGAWDYNPANHDVANWRNFDMNVGHFDPLRDARSRQYGWRLVKNVANVDYSGPAMYFHGSCGTDVLQLGPTSLVDSFGSGELADGPDVFVFESSRSLDFRTGSTAAGALRDNDLVVAGCRPNTDATYDITTTTIHTGPGRDWIFARDMRAAAVDAGNGSNGRTDALDPADGDDLVVLRGNMSDFRVFGGVGNDMVVWYVDDTLDSYRSGPNFFGGGGADAALWGDPGIDRLVLAVPIGTPIVAAPATPAGALLVSAAPDGDGSISWDAPTVPDPYAKYCITCGRGPGGRRTMRLEYNSATGAAHTGYFWVTAFEELQVGVGPGARVYRLDDVAGRAVLDPSRVPYTPPAVPSAFCAP